MRSSKHITRLRVDIADTTVGELGTDTRGRIYFQYDPTWLKTGFDLSPDTLPFQAEPQEFGGLHGVFLRLLARWLGLIADGSGIPSANGLASA